MQKTPGDADRHIGQRIRLRRLMIGMSQETLGERLGLTFQQVQKYEKGTNRVGAGRLYEIGNVLNVHVSFFYEGLPTIGGDTSASHPLAGLTDRESLRLARALSQIENNSVRGKLVDLMEALARD
jgi:DNA-binding XRE family transcriptional regulator